MSEMLGNHYFLIRKYCEALEELESALAIDPFNKSIRKKLIICFICTGKVFTAYQLFENLAYEDIDFIINTDPILDDCPCPEIIYELENSDKNLAEVDKLLALGILWLYCDVKESYDRFCLLSKNDKRYEKIQEILINHLNK